MRCWCCVQSTGDTASGFKSTKATIAMSRQYFGTDGVRGQGGRAADHARAGDASGLRGGQGAGRRRPPSCGGEPPAVLIGKDTRISGYMLESALQAGLSAAGVDIYLCGPHADPGGRLSDPRAAPVGRHRHQRLAQPVRGQRHQVLLRRGRQAARRHRAGDRGAAGRPDRDRALRAAGQGAAAQRRRRPLHRVLQEHVSRPTSICAA